jgi:hypothetical protein
MLVKFQMTGSLHKGRQTKQKRLQNDKLLNEDRKHWWKSEIISRTVPCLGTNVIEAKGVAKSIWW